MPRGTEPVEGIALRPSLQQEWDYLATADHVAPINLATSWRLEGQLNQQSCRAILAELVRRHDSFRTCVTRQNGTVVQLVVAELDIPLAFADLRPLASVQRTRVIGGWISRVVRRPVMLRQLPQVTAALFQLGANDHVLVLALPHTIWDMKSIGIFTRDFLALHAASLEERSSAPEPLSIGHSQWAAARRTRVSPASVAAWRERTFDLTPWLPLESKLGSKRAVPQRDCTSNLATLAPSACRALDDFARASGTGEGAPIIAAVAITLATTMRRWAFILGLWRASREAPESNGLVGFLAEPVLLPVRLSPSKSFRTAVQGIHHAMKELHEAKATLPGLYPAPGVSGPWAGETVCDAAVNYIPASFGLEKTVVTERMRATPSIMGMQLPRTVFWGQRSLIFEFRREPSGKLTGEIGYNGYVIRRQYADQLGGRFVALLRLAVANPDRPIESF